MKEIIMEKVFTEKAPAAVGPYSQAIITGNLVFTSGQIAVKNGKVEGSVLEQTKIVIKNLSEVLKAAGSGLERVVKTTCYLTDIKNFDAFNAIYADFFTSKPARTLIETTNLPKGALVEIEAVAELNQ